MAKNKLIDVRNHLFETLEMLTDVDTNTDDVIKRAKCVASISQVIINSAKLELDAAKVFDRTGQSELIGDFLMNKEK